MVREKAHGTLWPWILAAKAGAQPQAVSTSTQRQEAGPLATATCPLTGRCRRLVSSGSRRGADAPRRARAHTAAAATRQRTPLIMASRSSALGLPGGSARARRESAFQSDKSHHNCQSAVCLSLLSVCLRD